MKENAVSPVIGVLLMLTLTLIIAAIVNSYAGGLVDTEPKAPTATLQVSYSQSQGMEIRHVSGDPIPTSSVKLVIHPSETMGKIAGQYTSEINTLYISDNLSGSTSWINGITSLKPGEIGYVSKDDFEEDHIYREADVPKDYWISNSTNVGNTFFLEFYYKNTMINRNEVLIEE